MRPWGLLFTIILFPLLSASVSFADSRQEIIDNTLTQTETGRSSSNITPQYAYSDKILRPDIPLRQAPKTNIGSSGMSSEKRKAVEAALYLAAGYDVNHIHYSEWSGSDKLDEDFGNQDGFYINLGYRSPRYSETFQSKPFVEGYYRQYGDLIQYKGAASNGVITIPYNVKQKSAIRRFGLKVGGYRNISKNGEWFGYLDIGKRIWIRGENEVIDGVLNYKEIYHWIYGGLGLGLNYYVHPKLSIGLEWEGWIAGSPKMYAELYEGGTFKLKNVSGIDLKMPIKYHLLENFSFDLTPYFSYFTIGHSNTVILSGDPYYEPDSKTHEEGILLGFTYTL